MARNTRRMDVPAPTPETGYIIESVVVDGEEMQIKYCQADDPALQREFRQSAIDTQRMTRLFAGMAHRQGVNVKPIVVSSWKDLRNIGAERNADGTLRSEMDDVGTPTSTADTDRIAENTEAESEDDMRREFEQLREEMQKARAPITAAQYEKDLKRVSSIRKVQTYACRGFVTDIVLHGFKIGDEVGASESPCDAFDCLPTGHTGIVRAFLPPDMVYVDFRLPVKPFLPSGRRQVDYRCLKKVDERGLTCGTRVVVHSLLSEQGQRLNGCEGVIIEPLCNGRIRLDLSAIEAGQKRLKLENIRPKPDEFGEGFAAAFPLSRIFFDAWDGAPEDMIHLNTQTLFSHETGKPLADLMVEMQRGGKLELSLVAKANIKLSDGAPAFRISQLLYWDCIRRSPEILQASSERFQRLDGDVYGGSYPKESWPRILALRSEEGHTLNGRSCQILDWDHDSGRFVVRVLGEDRTRKLRPGNLYGEPSVAQALALGTAYLDTSPIDASLVDR